MRVPLEAAAWELYYRVYEELAEDLTEELDQEERELVYRYFGIFPYQPHSFLDLAKLLNVSKAGAFKRVRTILTKLKKIALLKLASKYGKRLGN